MDKQAQYLHFRLNLNHWLEMLESLKKDAIEVFKEGPIDLTAFPFGQQPYWFLSQGMSLICKRAYLDEQGEVAVDAASDDNPEEACYCLEWPDISQDIPTLSDFMDCIYNNKDLCHDNKYEAILEDSLTQASYLCSDVRENLRNELIAFVKKHQGEKGFILTDNKKCDSIYAIEYTDEENRADEFHVKAVRVNGHGNLQILTDNFYVRYDDDAVREADEDQWEDVEGSDIVYFNPTLENIANDIAEYVVKH